MRRLVAAVVVAWHLVALTAVVGVLRQRRPLAAHVPEPENPPALNASAEEYAKFRLDILQVMQGSLDAEGWEYQKDKGDGITIGKRMDPEGGCPWIRGSTLLEGCPIEVTSDYIIINPPATEWSPGFSSHGSHLREMELANGSMTTQWHWEHDNDILDDRAYWSFKTWQWVAPGVIQDTTTAFHGDIPGPDDSPSGVRSTEWAMHKLSDAGNGSTLYEVLWYVDLWGIVSCKMTTGFQSADLRKQVSRYREILTDKLVI